MALKESELKLHKRENTRKIALKLALKIGIEI